MRILIAMVLWTLSCVSAFAACEGRPLETDKIFKPPVCIPATPLRIVTLDAYFNLGMGLELGAPIVGAPLFGLADKALAERAQKAEVADTGHPSQPSVERILALKPDLILGDAFMHGRAYDLVTRVAPTVLINVQNWKEYYATIASVVGKTGQADAAFGAYDERVAQIKKKIPDIKVSVVRIILGGFQVYVDGPGSYAPFSIMHEAGVKRPAYETTTDATVLKRPDWEGLAALDGDMLLNIVGGGNDNDPSGRLESEALANPLWQMLPAVKAGRVHRLNPVTWMEFSGLGSANRVLDDIERYVIAAP